MHVRKWTHLARRVIPCQSCGAVIVAAGSARRMAGVDKIMADLGGAPFGPDSPGLSGDGSCETNRHCHPSEFDWTGLRRL